MAHGVRTWAREEIDRAVNAIDWAGAHTVRVAERYQELHPEIADPLRLAANLLEEAQTLIGQVKGSF